MIRNVGNVVCDVYGESIRYSLSTSYLYMQRQYIGMTVQAYAANEAGGKLEPFEYELGSLKPDEVEMSSIVVFVTVI